MPVFRKIRLACAGAAAAMALGVLASPAMAGTIRYTVTPNSSFTIHDNGNGIVKVTFNGCVAAGARQTLSFQMTTNVSGDSDASFAVLREEGGDPLVTFDPPTAFLQAGREQTFSGALSFTVVAQNNGITTFRIKLDPASGEGLGQGAGIMVSIPCVLAAPPGAAVGASGSGTAAEPVVLVPTFGVLPSAASSQARPSAPCVATPATLPLRAGRTSVVRVRVATNGRNIAGALVRLTGPGFVRSGRTRNDGQATFTVRPSRAGVLVVQSDVCLGADRITVRRAGAGAPRPRFTG